MLGRSPEGPPAEPLGNEWMADLAEPGHSEEGVKGGRASEEGSDGGKKDDSEGGGA